jgi:hypothetical protein
VTHETRVRQYNASTFLGRRLRYRHRCSTCGQRDPEQPTLALALHDERTHKKEVANMTTDTRALVLDTHGQPTDVHVHEVGTIGGRPALMIDGGLYVVGEVAS